MKPFLISLTGREVRRYTPTFCPARRQRDDRGHMRRAPGLTNRWRSASARRSPALTVPRRYPGPTDSPAGNAAPAYRFDSTALSAPKGELPEWGTLGSPAPGETARPPWAHARLEAVGVVLGQLQPQPPAANAPATRIYPRSRSWSQGAGSPGIEAHQALTARGRAGNHRNRMTMIHPARREAHRYKPATAS